MYSSVSGYASPADSTALQYMQQNLTTPAAAYQSLYPAAVAADNRYLTAAATDYFSVNIPHIRNINTS